MSNPRVNVAQPKQPQPKKPSPSTTPTVEPTQALDDPITDPDVPDTIDLTMEEDDAVTEACKQLDALEELQRQQEAKRKRQEAMQNIKDDIANKRTKFDLTPTSTVLITFTNLGVLKIVTDQFVCK